MAKMMSKMMRRTLKLGIFLTLGACLALPATAVGPAEGGLADLEIGGTAIHMTPLATGRLSLRVSGPGDFVYEAEMKGGEGLVFEIFDAAGEVLPDGVYNYEITAWAGKPKAAERENLRGLEKGRDGARQQSGVFTIRGGSLVQSGLEEPPAERPAQKADRQVVPTKDIVHNDDVIITGSLCVGFDCVNGENFGFDTVRLKENNLRIKADDTSNSGSFPKNDWQLTFNDSANGGAEKFSIDDVTNGRTPFTIEASAPSNSLYVDDGGRIGLGTSTPVVELHVVDGDSPTLRLEQNGSSGFTPQTWDVAGNETNFFVRDVTNGSKLPFRIRPTAPTDSLYINTDGNVGFGTSSPGAQIHVNAGSSTPVNMRLEGDSAGYQLIDVNGPTNEKVAQQFVNGGEWRVRGLNDALGAETAEGIVIDLGTGNVGVHRTTADGNPFTVGTNTGDGNGAHVTAGGTWMNGSSRAFKHHIEELPAAEAMAALAALNPVTYEYKAEPGEQYVGFIAEDVPDLVATNTHKYLSPMDIVAVLTKALQELNAKVEGLERELEAAQQQ